MQTKSFLKWAGGKSKLVPFIENSLPKRPRKRLIEPFAGSAALSLALEFDSYLLNDSNHDLIGLFQTLKQESSSLSIMPAPFSFPKIIVKTASTNCAPNSTVARTGTSARHCLST